MHTRPEICFAMSSLSQFMTDLRHVHWIAAKHVLRYLCGMIGYGLRYTSTRGVTLSSYIDLDWAGSVVDWKSTSGYYFSMGSTMISWSSRKQSFFLGGLFGDVLEMIVIQCNNQSCVKLSENPIFHDRSKHIEM